MFYKVCLNDDPWLTLTNLMAISKFQNLLFVPFLYQVSVYRGFKVLSFVKLFQNVFLVVCIGLFLL